MTDLVTEYVRMHVAVALDMVRGLDPEGLRAWLHSWTQLRRTYPVDYEAIVERARHAVDELIGGKAPGPLPQLGRAPHCAVEADIAREEVVAYWRARGVQPSTDPEWGEKLDKALAERLDALNAEARQREEKLQAQTRAATDELTAAEKLERLRERIERLESRPKSLAFRGVWKEGETYAFGDTTQRGGSLYVCIADNTTERPSDGAKSWRLAAKRGRDGKDLTGERR